MTGHTLSRIAFRVLGPLEVDGPDGDPLDVSGGKPATVLTLLLLHRNAWVSTDQLVDAVWAGRDVPASAQNNLKTYIWQLRRALPDERIESRPGAYRVRVEPGELDADLAAGLSDQSRKLLATGQATAAVEVAEQALDLWRGCPYDGLTGDTTSAVDRLTELHRSVREDLADAHLALGRSADAISLLRNLIDEDPLRELAWTRLMTAYRRTGRRHDALAAYQRARTLLIRELGIEPGPELTSLHQQLLSEETAPALAETPSATDHPAATRQPSADAATNGAGRVEVIGRRSTVPAGVAGFVGREVELELVRSTRADGVTVVTVEGMAGVGKTAFAVQAARKFDCPDGHLYLDLGTHRQPLGTSEALDRLMRMIGTKGNDWVCADWLARAGRVLLILDDVADAAQVRQLLPATNGAMVLVTSRHRLVGLDRHAAITLDPLPAAEAAQLSDDERVLRQAAGHPAAIRLLSDRIRGRRPWTVDRQLSRLDRIEDRLTALADVYSRFDLTYDRLREPLQRLYRLLGATPRFDSRTIARLAGLDLDEAGILLDELLDHHLVAEPKPGRFTLHPLVRDHAYAKLLAAGVPDEVAAAAGRRGELELVAPTGPRVA